MPNKQNSKFNYYKQILGESVTKQLNLKQFLSITEMDDVGDISYSSRNNYTKEDDQDFDREDGEDYDLGEFDNDDESDLGDLEGHTGHQLADIIDGDDLADQDTDEDQDSDFDNDDSDFDNDDSDEDEDEDEDEDDNDDSDFDNDDSDFDDNDQFPTKNDKMGDQFREGYQTKGSFLHELMLITEKKKSLKKAAKAVYRRDYIKTKNKPYRKYGPTTQGNSNES